MKRKIAFLLITATVLSCLALALPISAEQSDDSEKFPAMEGWEPIDEVWDWENIYSNGKFYLTEDIEFDSTAHHPRDSVKNVTIDGNGHKITLSQAQGALFTKVTDLTMSNITIEGDLVFSDGGGLNSPIAKWANSGATVLTNVTSRVNYTANTTLHTNQNLSGVAINAQAGSVFTNVIYEGTLTVRSGAKLASVSGIVYNAREAVFDGCINRGKIVIEGGTMISVTDRDHFYVGGIAGSATIGTVIKNCVNEGSVEVNGLPLRLDKTDTYGAYTIGGIVGYADNYVTVECCKNLGSITVNEVDNINNSGYVGGILGYSNKRAYVSYCRNSGSITVSENVYRVGGIIGSAETAILEGCTNSGELTSFGKDISLGGMMGYHAGSYAEFIRCTNEGDISVNNSTTGSNVGGMLGWGYHFGKRLATLRISDCMNTGDIGVCANTGGAYLGGLVGKAQGTPYLYITSSVNAGDISNRMDSGWQWCPTGGIIGAPMTIGLPWDGQPVAEHFISKCINTGTVKGGPQVGGIMGCNIQYLADAAELVIESCVNKGEIIGNKAAGGILGALNEGNVDSWDSSVGGTVYACENSGRVYSKQYAGGMIGFVYELKKTPEIIVDSCVNMGEIGSETQAFSGGLVGYSPFEVTFGDCISTGRVNGADKHPLTTAAFTSENGLYLAELWDGSIVGAEAADTQKIADKRATLDVLVYDMSAVNTLFDELGEIELKEYTKESRKAFRRAYVLVQNQIAFYETEVLQSQVGGLCEELLAAKALLVLREEETDETPEESGAEAGGETEAPSETQAPTETDTTVETEEATETEKSTKKTPAEMLADAVVEAVGCGSTVGGAAVAVIVAALCGCVAVRKKEK